jgi:hypothetical protein
MAIETGVKSELPEIDFNAILTSGVVNIDSHANITGRG